MGLRVPIQFGTANVARLLLSLIMAFAIWAFVTNERDPEETEVFENLEIEGANTLSPDLQIVDSFPEATVTVKGPQSVVQTMASTSVSTSVDLSGITEAGEYELEVHAETPSGLRDVEVEPETITIEVDSVVSRVFDITIVEPANPPATLSSISVSTSEVRLVGVQQNVERVSHVEVPVVLSGRTESFTFAAQPEPIGENGESMADTLRVEPQTVQVTVEFEVRARSVPVLVQCACPTEAGTLEIRDLPTAIAIPSTVRIEGPESQLAEVSAVRTVPINIEMLEESGFLPNGAELDDSGLPEGVTLERRTIDVYVEIEQAIQTFNGVDVEVVNAQDGVRVSVDPDTVTFELQGPTDQVAPMSEDPPLVVVDVAGLEPGTHIVAPRVVLPPDVRVINVQPEEVQVTIERIPPTPSPSPTPEPDETPSSSLPGAISLNDGTP